MATYGGIVTYQAKGRHIFTVHHYHSKTPF